MYKLFVIFNAKTIDVIGVLTLALKNDTIAKTYFPIIII
jgi:hypothetical protein